MRTLLFDFSSESKILISFSCGSDSVCLAHSLLSFVTSSSNITLIYFDHGLRPSEVNKEKEFILSFSEQYGFNHVIQTLPVQNYSKEKGISLEMAGRQLRYDALDCYSKDTHMTTILTAHHKNDVGESLLLKLFRGTRLLTSPIRRAFELSEGCSVYRPLLDTYKSDILLYLSKNKLSFCVDSSNESTRFKRNLIRSQDTLFKEVNSSYLNHLLDFSEYQNRVDNYFKAKCEGLVFNKCEEGFDIKLDLLPLHSDLELEYSLNFLLKQTELKISYVNASQILSLSTLILTKKTGSLVFAETTHICVTQSRLVVKTELEAPSFLAQIENVPGVVKLDEINTEVDISVIKSKPLVPLSTKTIAYLNYDHCEGKSIVVRSFKTGDLFQPFGMNCRKKVSDYFIDNKVDRLERLRVPLFFIDNQLAWVGGYQVSNQFRITENTKNVLKIQVKTNEK
ncbi:tRNA lysidine(34) synthetase TilS [Candidatus Marinamargulisbacteria bacterium SCGC AAA071-K20]|nr:tRNA lysidine(34) synthetase TilS [Candidatus Marinamargulisbacteria bacterium SCGC AAA071-K20]